MKSFTIDNVDIDLLRRQKRQLAEMGDRLTPAQQDAVDGILNLLDAITDQDEIEATIFTVPITIHMRGAFIVQAKDAYEAGELATKLSISDAVGLVPTERIIIHDDEITEE